MRSLILMYLICGVAAMAYAQEPTTVEFYDVQGRAQAIAATVITIGALETNTLVWDWYRGPPPNSNIPDRFTARCKTERNVSLPERSVDVPPEQMAQILTHELDHLTAEIPLKTLFANEGKYECTIHSYSAGKEGPPSSPFGFNVSSGLTGLPAAASNLRLR